MLVAGDGVVLDAACHRRPHDPHLQRVFAVGLLGATQHGWRSRFTHTTAAQLAPQVELIGGTQLGEQGPGLPLPLRRRLVAGVGHGASAAGMR